MICPRCNRDMIVVEHQQIELDYCTNCEGVWFDAEELDLLLQCMKLASPELVINNIVSLPPVESPGKPPKCPICGRGMKEVVIGQPALNIDVCRTADGLWFDGGEVHQLLRQLAATKTAGAETPGPVLEFLSEVFRGTEKRVDNA